MKCCVYIVLVLFFNAANSTFWYKDDFDRVTSTYNGDLTQDYLRTLSIFKRKLQLLGFYPIVLNDDGLEYVSVDPYLIDDDYDDYDDEMYKLLKKMRKEKKTRKKLLKKKLKKSKQTNQPPIATATVQPVPNIVYYWPSTITTIVHPVKDTSTFEHSFDTKVELSEKDGKKPYDNDSSEENSSEVDYSYFNQKNMNGKQKPANINYKTRFSFQRKFKFDDDDTQSGEVENQPSISSMSTTSTTTPYPLLTVFPDPDEVAIQEILNQQEIVNKISDEDAENITKTIPVEGVAVQAIESSTDIVKDKSTEADAVPNVTVEIPIGVYEDNVKVDQYQANSQDAKGEENILEESVASELQDPDISSIDVMESEAYTTESSLSIPSGILQFFHETLPDNDEQSSSIDLPSHSEIVANFPVPSSQQTNHSDEIAETSENNTSSDGHRETDTMHSQSTVEIIAETTTNGPTNQSVDEYLAIPTVDKVTTDSEVTIPTAHITDDSQGYEYSIDPKISLPIVIDLGDLESRSLIDEPVVAVIVDDINGKSGRRSDVPIEAEDEEDTTDNLPYNLTNENVLEQSSTIENNSAEVTSTPPNPADALTLDNMDNQFDGEIIPLIPIIIKQMKQGNVSPEEIDILKASFGQLWPMIMEEAGRDGDSSEEMNPMLSEVVHSVNRRIVKREATLGRRWGRPIYGRRIYFDDDDDYVPRRRYYGRRRPYVDYY